MSDNNRNSGFIAIISVIILSAVILLVSIGVSLRSISAGDSASGGEFSSRALALAEACAEHASLRLANNLSYAGNENIIVEGSDSCTVLPTEGTGNINRVIKAEAMVRGYKRRIRVDIAQVRPYALVSWREVSHF